MFYALIGLLTIIALSAIVGYFPKYRGEFTTKNGNITSEGMGVILVAGLVWPLTWLVIGATTVFEAAHQLALKINNK